MTAVERIAGAVITAKLDGDGRLISADAQLLALNARAGGSLGSTLASPPIATIVRLARRLGVVVSRAVTVADEEHDVEMWVRAQPEGDGIRLATSGWHMVPGWRPSRARDAVDEIRLADAAWRWETDASLRLTLITPEAGPAHGFDAFALLGRPMTALFDLEHEDDGLLPMLVALAGRSALNDQPARLRGTGAPLLLSAAARTDPDGRFAGFVGTVRTREAAGAIAAPGLPASFTQGLDRALRTPLARIVANADSINAQAEGPIAHDYADYAADIAHAGRHLLGLVDDLVDLQAVERPGFTLPAEPIDLADVARRAAGLLSVRAANADVTIVRPDPAASAPVFGDFRRALQIMVNLIGNAIRYSPAGATITVAVLGSQVTVADQGKGIARADQSRIFDKFERVDPREVGGNGLGLYIARRLARAMGGDLSVDSASGEGARFTLALPPR